ncbi:hypothetical protein ON010_g9468 [Phytophthora cinnamomi]|nr:hypothetical protein ON010_g9468 [Phytophthora cinnamomi]
MDTRGRAVDDMHHPVSSLRNHRMAGFLRRRCELMGQMPRRAPAPKSTCQRRARSVHSLADAGQLQGGPNEGGGGGGAPPASDAGCGLRAAAQWQASTASAQLEPQAQQQEASVDATTTPVAVCARWSERLRATPAVSYAGMLGPPATRARRTAPRYEANMLIDHVSMLKDNGIPHWYFQAVLTWKSGGATEPFMGWARAHAQFARLMQARPSSQSDCAQHAVDMALWLLGHDGAVTQAMKDGDIAAARKKGINLSKGMKLKEGVG